MTYPREGKIANLSFPDIFRAQAEKQVSENSAQSQLIPPR